MKKVVIEIFPDGSSKIDAQGFKGQQCSLATKELEMALVGSDSSAIDKRPKPDFYAQNPTTQVNTGR